MKVAANLISSLISVPWSILSTSVKSHNQISIISFDLSASGLTELFKFSSLGYHYSTAFPLSTLAILSWFLYWLLFCSWPLNDRVIQCSNLDPLPPSLLYPYSHLYDFIHFQDGWVQDLYISSSGLSPVLQMFIFNYPLVDISTWMSNEFLKLSIVKRNSCFPALPLPNLLLF